MLPPEMCRILYHHLCDWTSKQIVHDSFVGRIPRFSDQQSPIRNLEHRSENILIAVFQPLCIALGSVAYPHNPVYDLMRVSQAD
jgi:hypothetical protein